MSTGRRFLVRGRVQGVWFRESTRREALRLQITGHAVNLPDGSVEVVAFGDAAALSSLESWLRDGPELASVSSVEALAHEGAAPAEFTTG
jgi:acylphosphatase